MKKLVHTLKQFTPFTDKHATEPSDRLAHLAIYVPKIGRKTAIELSSRKLSNKLEVYSGLPLIRESAKYLRQLNRTEVRYDTREKLTNLVLNNSAETLADIYSRHTNTSGGLPESGERKESLTSAIALLDELGTSFKHSFKQMYTLSDRKFRVVLEGIYMLGVRILEMHRFEQRMRSLRYQMLSEKAWRECNQVYFALLGCGDVTHKVPLVRHLELCGAFNSIHGLDKHKGSLAKLFTSIHLFGILDVVCWPVHLNQTVDSCLCTYYKDISLLRDKEEELQPHQAVIYGSDTSYANFKRPSDTDSSYSVILDLSGLRDRLNKLFQDSSAKQFVGDATWKLLPEPLSRASPADSLGILKFMVDRLERRERMTPRRPLYESLSIGLYPGFADSYRLIRDLASRESSEALDGRGFRDALAGHSAMISDYGRDEEISRWSVINDSAGGMLVCTQETRYSNPMSVGQIVAYRVKDEQENPPQMGYVNRLHRSREGHVDVALVKISSYVEHISIHSSAGEHQTQKLPGILIRSMEGQWQLILPPRKQFVSGAPLKMRRQDQTLPVRIGEIRLSKKEFVVFDVRSPGLVP